MSLYIYNTRVPLHRHTGSNLVITIRFVAPPAYAARSMYVEPHPPVSEQVHTLWKAHTHKKVAMRLRLVDSQGSTKEISHAKSLLA